MLNTKDFDSLVTFQQQLEGGSAGPVVLMILFQVAKDDAQAFKSAWATDAAFTKAQPGFISAQLHQATGGDDLFLDYAIFESVAAITAMTQQPEFVSLRANYPDSAVASLHLFRHIGIPGICLGKPGLTHYS